MDFVVFLLSGCFSVFSIDQNVFLSSRNDSWSVFSDLTKPETFRDLSKPIGALNKERLERLLVCLS